MNRATTEAQRPHAARRPIPAAWPWIFADLDDFFARPSAYSKPHRKLCLGMLEGAVRDATQLRDRGQVQIFGVTRHTAMASQRETDARQLREWIAGLYDHPLSLRNVCEVLALDESWMRRGLFNLVGGTPGAPRKRGSGVMRRAEA